MIHSYLMLLKTETNDFTFEIYESDKIIAQFHHSFKHHPFLDKNFCHYAVAIFIKSLLMRTFPLEHFEIIKKFDETNLDLTEYCSQLAEGIKISIKNSNECLKGLLNFQKQFQTGNDVLFANIQERGHFLGLYEACKKVAPDRVHYHHLGDFWDPEKRQYLEKIEYTTVESFFRLVFEKGIRTIITPNCFYLEHLFAKHALHALPILHKLGLEYIAVDFDLWDLSNFGYLYKSLFRIDEFKSYAVGPQFTRFFDQKMQIKNSQYIPLCLNYPEKAKDKIHLDEDYKIIIRSNSRFQGTDIVKHKNISWVCSHLKPQQLFRDFRIWYFSMRKLLLQSSKLTEFELHHMNQVLFTHFIAGQNLLKFEVITQLETDREVLLFGDQGWKELCPQLYQNRFLSWKDFNTEFDKNKYLHLSFNTNYSYYHTQGITYECVEEEVPFLSWSALYRPPELAALEKTEFNSMSELKEVITQAYDAYQSQDLQDARKNYLDHLRSEGNKLVKDLLGEPVKEEYLSAKWEGQEEINRLCQTFIDDNKELINQSIALIFHGQTPSDYENNEFVNRSYSQKILGKL